MSDQRGDIPPPKTPPLWLPSAIGIVVALIVAAFVLFFLGGGTGEEEEPPAPAPVEEAGPETSLISGEIALGEELAFDPGDAPGPATEQDEPSAPDPPEETAPPRNEEAVMTVTGRVYDRSTGNPLPDTGLSLLHVNTSTDGHYTYVHYGEGLALDTGEDGRFRREVELNNPFPAQGQASVYLLVVPSGPETYAGPGAPANPADGGVYFQMRYENRTLQVDIPLNPGAALAGRVLEPDARTPAVGVAVEASSSTGARAGYSSGTETDEEGRFALELPGGSIGSVVARSETGAAEMGFRMPPEGAHSEVVLILTEFGSLAGQVVTPQGGPAARARVAAVSQTEGSGEVLTEGEADEWGRFLLPHVPAGEVELRARPAAEGEYFAGEPVDMELAVGEEKRGIVLELRGAETIPVRVETRDGEPIAAAQIVALLTSQETSGEQRRESVQGETDEEGRYVIEGVPYDGWAEQITARREGYQASTRRQVFPVHGEQVFRLEPYAAQEIVALWAEDRSPVTNYRYFLYRKDWTSYMPATLGTGVEVRSPEGRGTVWQVVAGDWRVDVVPVDEGGELTHQRGAAEFSIDPANPPADAIEVLVGAGYRVEGAVVLAETGEPVPDALVELEAPIRAGFDPVAMARGRMGGTEQPEEVRTDGAGRFEMEAEGPGDYTLTAVAGRYRTRQPVEVRLESPEEPAVVEVALEAGGVLYGQVIADDGQPISGADIVHTAPRPNYTNWPRTQHTTDDDGNYRIEGLAGGPHSLALAPGPQISEGASRDIDLDSGEERRVDFDFHNRIRVHGAVRTTAPLTHATTPAALRFHPGEEGADAEVPIQQGEPMTYEARLAPGTYRVSAQLHYIYAQGEGQFIEVPSEPAEQQHDIELDVVEADIVLVFPTDEDMEPGLVMIAPENRHVRYGFIRQRMQNEARASVTLMGGTYQATFMSEDGMWRGEAGPVELGHGQENMFVLEMKRVQRNIRIGTWGPSTITLQPTPHRYDVTEYIRSSGTVDILLEYDRGRNAAATLWATLYENGVEVSSDRREGWSGYEKWNNRYRLELSGYDPAAAYHVEVGLRADGGTDSHGSVYLSTN